MSKYTKEEILELVEQESAVGSFSLDVLAQDTETGANAVIENQLISMAIIRPRE